MRFGLAGEIVEMIGEFYFFASDRQESVRRTVAANSRPLSRVTMYALRVTEEPPVWPESTKRKREWVSLSEALTRCSKPWMLETLKTMDNHRNLYSGNDSTKQN